MFVGKVKKILPNIGEPERLFTQVGSGFTRKHENRLERLVRDKHTSLIWTNKN